ncbi:MAG: response regulator [SAR324 cluster bacterium]|nr:response regulator [SAR324 cluster bacterium]MBF0352507.1 response regulator [SAR324 cluster bacterium]
MSDKDINILVVDDIENMRKLIASMLFKLKYSHITTAANGREAWGKMQTANFDLVVADWNMPQMSGLDLLKAIRADPKMQDIPVLMVTAEAVKENIVAAAKHKVNGYIVKPFSPATLEEKIQDIMSKIKK